MADVNSSRELKGFAKVVADNDKFQAFENQLKTTRLGKKSAAEKAQELEEQTVRLEVNRARTRINFVAMVAKLMEQLELDTLPLDQSGWLGALVALKADAARPEGRSRFLALAEAHRKQQRKHLAAHKYFVTADVISEEMRAKAKSIALRYNTLAGALEGRADIEKVIELASQFNADVALMMKGERVFLVRNGTTDLNILTQMTPPAIDEVESKQIAETSPAAPVLSMTDMEDDRDNTSAPAPMSDAVIGADGETETGRRSPASQLQGYRPKKGA